MSIHAALPAALPALALLAAAQAPPAPAPAAPPAAAAAPAEPTAREAYIDCLRMAAAEPARAETLAAQWLDAGGGVAARHCLGEAQISQGRTEEAAGTFAAAGGIAEAEGLGQAAELYRLGAEAALLGGDLPRAEELGSRALLALQAGDRDGEAAIRKLRGRILVARGEIAEARGELAAATAARPDDYEAWLLLAAAARRDDDLAAAERAIREAVRLAPGNAAVEAEAARIVLSGEAPPPEPSPPE